MANIAPRSLRAAPVVCSSIPVAEFYSRLARCFGYDVSSPGVPGQGPGLLFTDPRSASVSYLLAEMMSKFNDGKPSREKDLTTWDRFHAAERSCFDTNQRLAVEGLRGPYEKALLLTRSYAARILGRFDWNAAAEWMDWGPGASTRVPRRCSDAAYKYSGNPETTAGNAALADAAIRSVPAWQQALEFSPGDVGYCNIVPGNRIVTVPKNYKTDRTIAIEPCMNMYVQKGIGGLMRKRLQLAACNLDDQSRNQRLAHVGSVAGTLATIDLSMASDTVSRVLVSLLIRPDWLEALEQSRSPFGVLPSGEKIFYQKFSSMGNGFTFELESLIFYSLALAWTKICGEEVSRVSVYGDDIILPSAVAESFIGLLNHVGFQANVKKSFWTGPFRESCGKHYFSGHDITPFYIRRPISKISDVFLLHNNLYRWLYRQTWISRSEFSNVKKLLAWVRSFASSKWRRPRLPDGFGDGAFVGSFDECCPNPVGHGLELWVIRVLSDVPVVDYVEIPGLLLKSLRNLERRQTRRINPLDPIEVHPSRGARHKEIKILIPWSSF